MYSDDTGIRPATPRNNAPLDCGNIAMRRVARASLKFG